MLVSMVLSKLLTDHSYTNMFMITEMVLIMSC